MADGDVADDAGVVVIVAAAEAVDALAVDDGVGEAFVDFILRRGRVAGDVLRAVDGGATEDDDAAPETALEGSEGRTVQAARLRVVHVVRLGGEDDGIVRGADGEELATLRDEERAGRRTVAGLGLDDRARLDGEGLAVLHVNEAVQDVSVRAIPSHRSGVHAEVGVGDVHDAVRRAAREDEAVFVEGGPLREPQVVAVKRTLVGGRREEAVVRRKLSAGERRCARREARVEDAVGRATEPAELRAGQRVRVERVGEVGVRRVGRGVRRRDVEDGVLDDHFAPVHFVMCVRVHEQARAELGEDRVANLGRRVVTDVQRGAGGNAFADGRPVPDLPVGLGQHAGLGQVAVKLATPVRRQRVLDGEPELVLAAIAHVRVERVVVAERAHQVARVDRAAKELEAVIRNRVGLDILQRRPATHTAAGQTVNFLVRLQQRAAVANRDVAQHTGAVVVVAAAEAMHLEVREALIDFILRRGRVAAHVLRAVDGCATEQHHAAPETALERGEGRAAGRTSGGVIHVVRLGSENDGFVGRALGKNLTAARHEERAGRCARAGLGLHDRAGFDVQNLAGFDIDEAVEDVGIGAIPIDRAGDVRVADLVGRGLRAPRQQRGKRGCLDDVFQFHGVCDVTNDNSIKRISTKPGYEATARALQAGELTK